MVTLLGFFGHLSSRPSPLERKLGALLTQTLDERKFAST